MKNPKEKGTKYELKIINELRSLGFEAVSTRQSSRLLDSQGVDILTNFPFNIQCKRVEKMSNFEQVLEGMNRDKDPVIFHKKNHKPDIVIMLKEDFYKIGQLIAYWDELRKTRGT